MKLTIFLVSTLVILSACGRKTNNTETTLQKESAQTVVSTPELEEKPEIIESEVSLTGIMVLAPQNIATISRSISGIVKSTSIIAGKYIAKGEVIATLENPEFITLQQEFLDSRAKEEYLESEYKRQQTLNQQNANTKKRLEESRAEFLSMKAKREAMQAQIVLLGVDPISVMNSIIPLLEIKSPIAGYISKVNINPGKYIEAGTPICEVLDKSETMLKLALYEKDIEKINVGDYITFSVNSMKNKKFSAKIISIGQQVDELNRSLEVYAQVYDKNQNFRPGIYVTANLTKK